MDGSDNNEDSVTLLRMVAQLVGCSSNFRGKFHIDKKHELAAAFAKMLPIRTLQQWRDAQVCYDIAKVNKAEAPGEFDREYADLLLCVLSHKFEDARPLFKFGSHIVYPIGELYHKGDDENRVLFYEQQYYVLSNFSAFKLDWKGYEFHTSEAAYHWEKFHGRGEGCFEAQRDIIRAPSAHEALQVARRAEKAGLRHPDWDKVKVGIMEGILRAKVNQHEYVKRQLLATGDRELIEDSWQDSFWGWGAAQTGQNQLGKLWMKIREDLRKV